MVYTRISSFQVLRRRIKVSKSVFLRKLDLVVLISSWGQTAILGRRVWWRKMWSIGGQALGINCLWFEDEGLRWGCSSTVQGWFLAGVSTEHCERLLFLNMWIWGFGIVQVKSGSCSKGEVSPLDGFFNKLTSFSNYVGMPVVVLKRRLSWMRGKDFVSNTLGEKRKPNTSSCFDRETQKLEWSVNYNRSPNSARGYCSVRISRWVILWGGWGWFSLLFSLLFYNGAFCIYVCAQLHPFLGLLIHSRNLPIRKKQNCLWFVNSLRSSELLVLG